MSTQDLQQAAFFTIVGAVALLALWYIFIQAPKARSAEMAAWAAKRGLRLTPPISLGSHTVGHEVGVLEGAVQGVAFRLTSSRLVNSRRAGVNGHCEIESRALAPAPLAFTIILERGPSPPAPDAVRTNDPGFDARVRARSDNVAAAAAWLAPPHVRAALANSVGDGAPIMIRYVQGAISIRLAQPIFNEGQLDRTIGMIVAAAHARPA